MIAFSPKAMAVAAITMSLSSSALACLHLTGEAFYSNDGSPTGSITATDSGVKTCFGYIVSGDNNIPCIKGYALNYDSTDNNQDGPLPITYCNPHSCYGIEIPLKCDGECTFDFCTFCS